MFGSRENTNMHIFGSLVHQFGPLETSLELEI